MSVGLSPVSHAHVCSAIDSWTCVQRGSISALTQQCLDDVRAQQNLAYWANVSLDDVLVQHIPRPRVLLALRSMAMLLPILLTWLSLSQVVDHYARYVQNVDSGANFLWFWQSNPGNQFLSVWTLQHVALVDTALLVFVVVISLRISWYENSVVDELEKRHEEMVTMISVYLRQFSGAREVSHHGNTNHHQNGAYHANNGETFVESNNANGDRYNRLDSAEH